MAPFYMDRNFYPAGSGYLTPEEPPANQPLVDSPLETRQPSARMEKATQDTDQSQRARNKSDTPPEQNTKNDDSGGLRFMVVSHPDELKNRTQMRKNRIHVMHNYLAKEAQNPDSKDSRVHGSTQVNRRRKARPSIPRAPSSSGTSDNPNAPQNISRPDVSRLTPADSVQSRRSSHEASDREAGGTSKRSKIRTESTEATQRLKTADDHGRSLVRGIGGNFENTRYMQASTLDIPFGGRAALLGSNVGGNLEPFGTWPAFSDSTVDVNELKWSCSQRFGSSSLSVNWVPTLLRARHAFLSTLCISSAHDDIMRRAFRPSSYAETGESFINRIRVRQGVISLINQSINDPEMRTADETIVAVLHVLNSEIMGCDDKSMRVHQLGLHDMIRERGGLDRLGVAGQLAAILTITMYLIGALRDTPPHRDFVEFASKQITKIPSDPQRLPESPIYYRPQGYRTINNAFRAGSETFELLNTLRALTNKFYIENEQYSFNTASPFRTAKFWEQSDETVSSLYGKIFEVQPAADKDFNNDMNKRYTFESIRLASLVYAHALANRIPFSKAATQVRSTSASGSDSIAKPMPIQIKEALMRTDTSYCWDHLAGVLFWVTLVAGAAANPGPISNEERVGEDEDARKWLTAIAVRCCIVLSFEYGHAVLETLKRTVAIETVLGRSALDDGSISTADSADNIPTDSKAGERTFGPAEPPPLQRGFADFAQEFMSI